MVTELSVLSGIPPKLKLLHHLWNKNIKTWETSESLFNQNVQSSKSSYTDNVDECLFY